MYLPLNSRDWWRALGLGILSILIWLWFQEGWSSQAWQVPAAPRVQEAYTGDQLELLMRIKAAREDGWGALVGNQPPRLGAPWTADWSSYPMPDRPLVVTTGLLARVTGLIPAANLALLLAHVLAVLAFYFCSRSLGHRPEFAAAAALLFGFCYFNWRRSLVHFSFTLSFVVPLILLVCFLAASSRVHFWRRRGWFGLGAAVALWLGFANPYYGLVFAQLMIFGLLYRWFTVPGPDRRPGQGLALLGIFLGTLVLANWSALAALAQGSAPLGRNYAGTEIYSLRLIELFIPPPSHPWFTAAAWGHDYARASFLQGEFYYPYLGLAGIGALLLAVALGLQRLLQNRFGLRPAYLPLIGWILLYSCTGGVNSLVAFTTTTLFRGSNRFSIFILALALLAVAAWATRCARGRSRWLAGGIAALLTLVGLWDQSPARRLGDESHLRAKIMSDRELGRALESALPAGAMVFQLPAVPFLEQPVMHRMLDYEPARPYLFTDTLRFSYGWFTGTRELRWQQHIARLPAPALRTALEAAGFSAIYLQRAAYPDSARALAQELERAGLPVLFDAGDHLAFRLQPAARPVTPPLDDPRLLEPWPAGAAPGAGPAVFAGRGWFGEERDAGRAWRWAGREATMLLHNPAATDRQVELTGTFVTLKDSTLTARLAGRVVWQAGQNAGELRATFRLPPGLSELSWETSRAAQRLAIEDSRKLAMMISDLRLQPAAAP